MQPKHYSTDFSSSRPNSRRQVRKQNKTSPGAPNRKNICINYSKQNWNLGRLRKKTKQNGQCQGSSGVKIGVVSSTCTSTFPTNKPCTSPSCTIRQSYKLLLLLLLLSRQTSRARHHHVPFQVEHNRERNRVETQRSPMQKLLVLLLFQRTSRARHHHVPSANLISAWGTTSTSTFPTDKMRQNWRRGY